MTAKKLVTERKEGGETFYDFRCPEALLCNPGGDPFSSVGWATRELAEARGRQHQAEHESGEVMPELDTFRTANGLTAETAGQAAKPADWTF